MFGADVLVVESLGLLIGELHHLASTIGEAFIHAVNSDPTILTQSSQPDQHPGLRTLLDYSMALVQAKAVIRGARTLRRRALALLPPRLTQTLVHFLAKCFRRRPASPPPYEIIIRQETGKARSRREKVYVRHRAGTSDPFQRAKLLLSPKALLRMAGRQESLSFIIQAFQCLLDLPLPLGPALKLETLAKCALSQCGLLQTNVEGSQVQEGVGIRLVKCQDVFNTLSRVVPASLKVSLHRVAKEPLDFSAMPFGMTQPDPPESIGKANQPGQKGKRGKDLIPAGGKSFRPDPARDDGQVERHRKERREDQTKNFLPGPDPPARARQLKDRSMIAWARAGSFRTCRSLLATQHNDCNSTIDSNQVRVSGPNQLGFRPAACLAQQLVFELSSQHCADDRDPRASTPFRAESGR